MVAFCVGSENCPARCFVPRLRTERSERRATSFQGWLSDFISIAHERSGVTFVYRYYDQDELERQLNARATVPDIMPILARYV
jgi:hypothetical protein